MANCDPQCISPIDCKQHAYLPHQRYHLQIYIVPFSLEKYGTLVQSTITLHCRENPSEFFIYFQLHFCTGTLAKWYSSLCQRESTFKLHTNTLLHWYSASQCRTKLIGVHYFQWSPLLIYRLSTTECSRNNTGYRFLLQLNVISMEHANFALQISHLNIEQ